MGRLQRLSDSSRYRAEGGPSALSLGYDRIACEVLVGATKKEKRMTEKRKERETRAYLCVPIAMREARTADRATSSAVRLVTATRTDEVNEYKTGNRAGYKNGLRDHRLNHI